MAYGTSIKPLVFFFSQNYTEEQNSQRRTETLSQPMTQSVLSNVKGSGPSPNPSPAGLLFLHIFFKTCIEGYLVFKYS